VQVAKDLSVHNIEGIFSNLKEHAMANRCDQGPLLPSRSRRTDPATVDRTGTATEGFGSRATYNMQPKILRCQAASQHHNAYNTLLGLRQPANQQDQDELRLVSR
jgi:hypothetical protein